MLVSTCCSFGGCFWLSLLVACFFGWLLRVYCVSLVVIVIYIDLSFVWLFMVVLLYLLVLCFGYCGFDFGLRFGHFCIG